MARFFQEVTKTHQAFIENQKIFFVCTAPEAGRLSLSPKGMDSFLCLSPHEAAFLNVTGSGNETAAHLKENGRITVMFCSFDEKPLILRLYGHAEAIHPNHEDWERLYNLFQPLPGARQIIKIKIESVQTSCGESIPFYEFQGHRDSLNQWAIQKGPEGVAAYQQQKNRKSIDGLDTGLNPQET